MLRYLIVDVLLPLLVFLLIRSIIRSIFQPSSSVTHRPAPRENGPTVVAGGELKKDPVCGTYVSTSLGWTRTVKGEPVYFCSKECRDKYVA
jgi:YHS domain-containing protein